MKKLFPLVFLLFPLVVNAQRGNGITFPLGNTGTNVAILNATNQTFTGINTFNKFKGTNVGTIYGGSYFQPTINGATFTGFGGVETSSGFFGNGANDFFSFEDQSDKTNTTIVRQGDLVAGSNISLTKDGNTISIAATGSGFASGSTVTNLTVTNLATLGSISVSVKIVTNDYTILTNDFAVAADESFVTNRAIVLTLPTNAPDNQIFFLSYFNDAGFTAFVTNTIGKILGGDGSSVTLDNRPKLIRQGTNWLHF